MKGLDSLHGHSAWSVTTILRGELCACYCLRMVHVRDLLASFKLQDVLLDSKHFI